MNWKTKKPVFKPGRSGAVVNTQEVWVVSAGDNYYPSTNNIRLITNCHRRASDFRDQLSDSGSYDWVELDKEVMEYV